MFLPAAAVIIGCIDLPRHLVTATAFLVTALALLCRFTRPIASLLVGAGVAVVASIGPSTALAAFFWPAGVVLSYAVGRYVFPIRRALVPLAIAAGAQAATGFATQVAEAGFDPADAGLGVVTVVLLVVLPGAIGMLQGERARTIDALHGRNTLMERANLLGESQARMQERARIAGEMHDLLGHRLSLIVLYAGALEVHTRDAAPKISKQADLLRVTSRTALDELRAVLGILRLDGGERTDDTESVVGTRADVTDLVTGACHAVLARRRPHRHRRRHPSSG